jgi:aminopeptidase N
MVDVLDSLANGPVADADLPKLRAFADDLLTPTFAKLGWLPDDRAKTECPRCEGADDDETNQARLAAIEALGAIAHDKTVLTQAKARAELYLAGAASVRSDDGQVALRLAAGSADAAFLSKLEDLQSRAAMPSDRIAALNAAASVEDPALLRRTLDRTLDGSTKLQDLRYVLSLAFERRSTRDAAFAWLVERSDAASKALPGYVIARFSESLGATCTTAARDARRDFLTSRLAPIEGTARGMAIAADRAAACIDFASSLKLPL